MFLLNRARFNEFHYHNCLWHSDVSSLCHKGGSFLFIELREVFEFGEGCHPLYSQFLPSSIPPPFSKKKKKKPTIAAVFLSFPF